MSGEVMPVPRRTPNKPQRALRSPDDAAVEAVVRSLKRRDYWMVRGTGVRVRPAGDGFSVYSPIASESAELAAAGIFDSPGQIARTRFSSLSEIRQALGFLWGRPVHLRLATTQYRVRGTAYIVFKHERRWGLRFVGSTGTTVWKEEWATRRDACAYLADRMRSSAGEPAAGS